MIPWIWESKAKIKTIENKLNNKGFDSKIISYFKTSLDLNKNPNIKNLYQIENDYLEIGKYFSSFPQFQDSAIYWLAISFKIAKSMNDVCLMMKTSKKLSLCYNEKNYKDLAYKYLFTSDSINSIINNSQLNILNTNYLTQQKAESDNNTKFNNAIFIAIFILIAIVGIIFFFSLSISFKRKKNYDKTLNLYVKQLFDEKINLQNKQVEIQEKDKVLELLMKNSQDGIYMIQGDNFTFVNESFCKMTGYNEKELKNKSYLNIVHNDDKEYVKAEVISKLTGKNSYPHKFRLIKKNNDERIVFSFSETENIKNIQTLCGYLRDITEEEKYKQEKDKWGQELEDKIAKSTSGLILALEDKQTILDCHA